MRHKSRAAKLHSARGLRKQQLDVKLGPAAHLQLQLVPSQQRQHRERQHRRQAATNRLDLCAKLGQTKRAQRSDKGAAVGGVHRHLGALGAKWNLAPVGANGHEARVNGLRIGEK